MTTIDIIKLGYYSPSQNGVIVSKDGCAPCLCGGGRGHDVDVPKILIDWNGEHLVTHDPCRAEGDRRRQKATPCERMCGGSGQLSDGKDVQGRVDQLLLAGSLPFDRSIDRI